MKKLKIKKGDTVKVIAGNDKGKTGKVMSVDAQKMKIKVEGVCLRTKHVKASQANPNGGIIKKEGTIHYSNVALMDKSGKPTRISIKRVEEKGKKVRQRIAKTTGEVLAS